MIIIPKIIKRLNKGGRTIMKNAHLGYTERLLSKHLQNIVPQFLTESIVCVRINRQLGGQKASWLRTRTKLEVSLHILPFLNPSFWVFPGFHLNVSLIFGIEIENQDHHVSDNVCEKNYSFKKKTIRSSVKVYFSLHTSIRIIAIPKTLCYS